MTTCTHTVQAWACAIFTAASITATMPAFATTMDPVRELEVSIVTGKSLPKLLGQSFDNYSVMVVTGDKLAAIPFQFDDIDSNGYPYVTGQKPKIKGQEGVMEEHDELVFMLKDTGDKLTAAAKSGLQGELVSELEFKEDGASRYAYLIKGNPERDKHHYTFFDKKTGLGKTDKFSLQVDPENALVWSDFFYKDFKGDHSVLDTMKVRIKAKLGFIKATIGNKLIPNEIVGVKNGPVRSIIAVDASLSILGIPLLEKAGANFIVTNQNITAPVYAYIPKAAGALSDLNIEVSLDFHKLDGAKIRSAKGPAEPIIVGGKGADPSKLHVTLEDNWLSGSSGKGADIIAFFEGTPKFKPSLDAFYKGPDDIDEPERYPGGHPQVGYLIGKIPTSDDIVVGIDLFFSDRFWQGNDPSAAIKKLRNPVPVTVNAI